MKNIFFSNLICSLLGITATSGLFASCNELTPLNCNHFSIQLKGGIAPAHYTKLGLNWITAPTLSPVVFSLNPTAKFRNQFKMPYELGAEIEWNASSHVQFFLEGVYNLGKAKTYIHSAGIYSSVIETFTDYKTWGGYLGTRYFFDRCFCDIAPFLGVKAGLIRQKQVDSTLTLDGVFIQSSPYFFSQTAVSGGFQGGLDWHICGGWNLELIAEVVVTQGLKNNRNVVLSPIAAPLSNINLGEIGRVVSFPITLGVRYEF